MPAATHLFADALPAPARGCVAAPLPVVDSLSVFGMRVSRHFAQCRRENGRLALLWVDVQVMSGPGQPMGDAERESLLHVASQRLRNRVRGADEVVRVGDKSFAVLLLAAGAPEAQLVERRLRQTLRGGYGVDGRLTQLGVRMGTAVFPEDGRQGIELAEAAQQRVQAVD